MEVAAAGVAVEVEVFVSMAGCEVLSIVAVSLIMQQWVGQRGRRGRRQDPARGRRVQIKKRIDGWTARHAGDGQDGAVPCSTLQSSPMQ